MLIEAGMTGLPVVTTDVPGAREVVVDGATGFVVSVDDFDGLVERTQPCCSMPNFELLSASRQLRTASRTSAW